jgi:hypothetical protein
MLGELLAWLLALRFTSMAIAATTIPAMAAAAR